ncbi:MAG: NF038122 family metalloprotease [Acidobacteria bacterium]|nr:NF038122 family metalloprotease [Acidobacteriota bacterium]
MVLSGTAQFVARAQSEQGGVEAPAAKGYPSLPPEEGDAFIIKSVNGAVSCRVATPSERLQILRRDPSVTTRPVRRANASQTFDPQSKTAASEAGDTSSNLTAGHLDIVLRPTAQLQANPEALAAFERAAATWENLITTEITVVVDVDFGTTRFGTAYGSGVIGATSGGIVYIPPYTDVRARLVSHATAGEESALDNILPTGSVIPTDSGSPTTMRVSSPQARALGAIAPNADPNDTANNDKLGSAPSIGFNSAFTFDFDPSDGIASGKIDFDSVVTHELGHALGFVSDVGILEVSPSTTQRPTIWDLFRFRPGTTFSTFQTAPRIATTGGEQRYYDGGVELALSTGNPAGDNGDGEQASHWKDDRQSGFYIGIMDPTIGSGVRRAMTDNDRRAIDFLGYSLAPLPPGPANDNFANAVNLQGASGSVNGTNVNARKEAGEPAAIINVTNGGRSVWYSWTAPATGTATFDTVGSGFDTTLSVFVGSVVNGLVRVIDNDDINTQAGNTASRVTFNVNAGQVYRIMVDGFDGDSGSFVLNWTSGVPLSYSVTGRVQDSAGNGIQGVRVAIDGPNMVNTFPALPATTDAGGNFQFSLLTPGGNYTVRSDDSRYAFTPATAVFNNISANQTVTFTTSPLVVPVTGRVLEGAQGLAGVYVGLYDNNGGFLQQTTTAADGRWTFSNVGTNRGYSLQFVKAGYTLSPFGFPVTVGSSAFDAGVVNAVKANQVEETTFFVTQHYRDFLGREPDQSGLNFWVGEVENCGVNRVCREVKRVNVSAAFFQSIEFQNTGYLVERMYKVAYGDRTETSTNLVVPAVTRQEFVQDTPLISTNLVVGQPGWELTLENNKVAYLQAFVQRQRFTDVYGAFGPAQFVDRLNQNAGLVLTAAERSALIDELTANNTVAGRASVLRKVAENAELDRREKNRAFVLMEYFGYLRRNPSDAPEVGLNYAGWNFWLGKLNDFGGDYVRAEMVKAFLDSTEYRARFANQ